MYVTILYLRDNTNKNCISKANYTSKGGPWYDEYPFSLSLGQPAPELDILLKVVLEHHALLANIFSNKCMCLNS